MKTAIAKNLKLLRVSAGYTQKEVAEFIRIERGAYANYESADPKRLMPFNLLLKICDLYGVSMNDLINENNESNKFVYAFRINSKDQNDLIEIAKFKKIIRNYLKISSLYENNL